MGTSFLHTEKWEGDMSPARLEDSWGYPLGPWPMTHLPIVDGRVLRRAGEHHHGEELDELRHCLQR